MADKTIIELHPKQFKAYSFDTQFGAVVCGVQSGKTYLGCVWAQKKIGEFPKGHGLIAAPTVKILNHSTLEKFFQLWPEYRKYYKKQEGVIMLPEGGKIFIRSTDEPLGLEGMTLNWAWLDEAGMMARMVYTVIRARVSTTNGQVIFTSTPYNLGWLYQQVYLPWKEKTDQDVSCFTWKSTDNPYFPKEYADKERARMSVEEYARRYEGEFTKMEGLVWDLPSEQIVQEDEAVKQLLKYPDYVVAGVDWGFRNPTGILIAKVKDGAYYIVDEWKAEEKTTSEICDKAREFTNKYKVDRWYPDPAEPDRIEELKRRGLSVGETNKDIPLGVSTVESLIREKRLFIIDSCTDLLDEVGQYHYEEDKEGKTPTEKPVKLNDHLCDALRYMVMGYRVQVPVVKKMKLNTYQAINAQMNELNKTRNKKDYGYT